MDNDAELPDIKISKKTKTHRFSGATIGVLLGSASVMLPTKRQCVVMESALCGKP